MPDAPTFAPPHVERIDQGYNRSPDRTDPDYAVVRAEVSYAGYVWIAYASKLPVPADGGHPSTHRLVTLLTLKGTAAHVLAADGYLHPSYLDEKFGHVVPDQYAPGAWAAIGAALGREVGQ